MVQMTESIAHNTDADGLIVKSYKDPHYLALASTLVNLKSGFIDACDNHEPSELTLLGMKLPYSVRDVMTRMAEGSTETVAEMLTYILVVGIDSMCQHYGLNDSKERMRIFNALNIHYKQHNPNHGGDVE